MDYKEKIIALLNSQELSKEQKEKLESIFPELKEGEDERIRKELIQIFNVENFENYDIKNEEVIAWLEKQGEQKATIIIPKFRVGDEIKTSNEESLTVTKIDEKGYWSEDLFICGFDDAAKWELVEPKSAWSEEDEKVIYCLEYTVKHFYEDEDTIKWCCDWLKSLKPQNTWKPSDEQMKAIKWITDGDNPENWIVTLANLYNDLKKLKG